MTKNLLAAAALLSLLPALLPAHAALTTSATAQPWVNDSTLAGWSLFLAATGAAPATYVASTGASNAGGFFSRGTAAAADRALGGLGSAGAYFGTPAPAVGAPAGWLAVAFNSPVFTNPASGALVDGRPHIYPLISPWRI